MLLTRPLRSLTMNIQPEAALKNFLHNTRVPFHISRLLSPLTRKQCTSKWSKLGRKIKILLLITSSVFPLLTQNCWIPLVKQSITPRNYSRLTTPILYRIPHQTFNFLLQLPENILLLIVDYKGALPPLPLPLHPRPMLAVLSPFPICPLKHPFQIPLIKHQIFTQHIHLTSQRNSLPQFQIPHQVTLPELNPLNFQKLLQLRYQ